MKKTMKRAAQAFVGVVAGALMLSGCGTFSVYDLPLPGGVDAGDNAMTVTAQFQDVLDLVPQSTVKLEDVDVGKINKVWLDDGVATVEMKLKKDVNIPGNARASIQQTSLLGEKFISLEQPSEPESTKLADGSMIPLSQTGRNPEIEEVFSALSLLLNGGGVAQLKTISTELNKALAGREDSARSVLHQVEELAAELDNNKQKIVSAIEALDALAKATNAQMGSIDAALDELPSALSSIDKQRGDLVKMLKALDRLGDTGVRVIRASKDNTIGIVKDLKPVLSNLADSGDKFVRAMNTILTYPFVDQAVGGSPQAARNLHMGDFVNLDVTVDLNLDTLLDNAPDLGGAVCWTVDEVNRNLEKANGEDLVNLLKQVKDLACGKKGLAAAVSVCQQSFTDSLTGKSTLGQLATACGTAVREGVVTTLSNLLGLDSTSGAKAPSTGDDKGLLCNLPLIACRAGANADGTQSVTYEQLSKELDPGLTSLMIPALSTSKNTHGEGVS
ncbi:virulence factor Mce-like protein [Nocardioides albertanoniae]|uniref:Virulence factor Mce-like protein n=1 Tax=Nocardioides albertanoniae TaxID=1175486 RepID=A0A543AD39_9ACTN|nr:MCE family protein [Nocardioides albertanoniae]TQL70494.1 virulence factor Mce-like protein [Nocardioides albertanoniae]